MSLELLSAEGGMDSIARTIGRHLKLNWDLTSWELTLKSPHTDKYKLYRVNKGENLELVATNCPADKIPWQRRSKGDDIISRDIHFGNFRFDEQKMRTEDRDSLNLYFRFIGQAYEHYYAKQHLVEGRAETLESLPLGIASLDSQGDIIDMNEEMSRLLGGATISGAKQFSELFKIGLGSSIGNSWDEFLEDDSKKSFSKIICASLRTGGVPRDACLYVSAYKQERDEEELVTLIMEDIREISESQIQALKQRDFLEGLVDSMRDVVLTVDKRGNIHYASSRFSKIFLGRNIFDIATPSDTFTGRWGPELFEKKKTIVEVLLKRTETSGRPFEFGISKLAGPGEKSLIVARDLTAIRRLEEKLKRQAVFDGLTDLYNHTQFNSLMVREIKRSIRTGRPVGLLFFDLDGFKAVNDNEGHQVGDEVLKAVGEILRNELRSGMDFPCRYGGDEFGVIVTEVRPEALEKIGNRIRLRVEKKFSGKVTISGGLTVLKEGDTSTSMLSRADKATYEAKDLGGNVLVWAK
ncbi:diguanylate cyclase [Maridesulfovibrio sp.]|uniref:sensor domain-containing diguanylate cyclase n=1 Tax=Maridesulfovibrio sp. TaxID=2795000 RepID=UPI0029F51C27|nr:diguanylate cyclase [Maridesulfovibrio sp.]